MVKKSFFLYTSQHELVQKLNIEQKANLLDAIYHYAEYGEMVKMDGMTELVMITIKQAIDRDSEKYQRIVERNKENIKKRYSTKPTSGRTGKPNLPEATHNGNDNNNDNGNVNETEEEENAPLSSASSKKDNIPYEKIRELFNGIVAHATSTVPTCMDVTATRKQKVRARWKGSLPNLEAWEQYFKRVAASDFLMNAKMTDFGWLINAENCTKILEDKYSNFRNQNRR